MKRPVGTDPRSRPGSPKRSPAEKLGLDPEELERLLGEESGFMGQPIEIRETHASLVFLTPTDVYKLKKPINLGFLNYSSLSRRSHMCRQEVLLNRRLAPDVYLGVKRLTRGMDGRLRLGGRGRTVDYLVHMRRLPDATSLACLLDRGLADEATVRAVGTRIGTFHREAPLVEAVFGPRTFFRNARENLVQLRTVAGTRLAAGVLEEFEAYLERARVAARKSIDQRVDSGRIRDGHGDLRAEHVYFDYFDGRITIIDCIEFDARFRYGDTALDFAFLVMDLTVSGCPNLVRPLVDSYEAAAGDSIAAVLPLYCWYRSLVRAKVAGILANSSDATADARLAAALVLRRHIHHALRFARDRHEPLLLLVGGLPGTGKSTVARALASALGATVKGADETRKRLAGSGPGGRRASLADNGIYSSEMNRRVYSELLRHAAEMLAHGGGIVLDATFRLREDREAARSLALQYNARFLMVECEAPEDVVVERLKARIARPDPWSDATVDTYLALRSQREPATELDPGEYLAVTTIHPLLSDIDTILLVLWK